ncbi:MAG: thioredoxin family protein [bacterium]
MLKQLCIFLIVFTVLCLGGQKVLLAKSKIERQEIKWYHSFEKGLKMAKKKNKPLMVDFEAKWCIWCKRLDATTYKNPEVIALSKKFIPVKIDCEVDKTTPNQYAVRGLPTIIFMDTDSQVIHQVVGYRGPKDFITEMKKALASTKGAD